MSIPRVLNKKNRVLLKELTKTDFKLRYQGSVLGYLWALLRPLMMFAILYVVFAKLLKIGNDIPHYSVYLLCGTAMWSFFTECASQGIQAIVNRGDLLRKISFPKYIVVVSATLTAVINMLINLVVITRTENLKEECLTADILVAAVGKAYFVTADMVKDGAVVIDVGMNRNEEGKLCGDVCFDEVSLKASYITPVPGGVGPMTITMLLENTVRAAEMYKSK